MSHWPADDKMARFRELIVNSLESAHPESPIDRLLARLENQNTPADAEALRSLIQSVQSLHDRNMGHLDRLQDIVNRLS